MDLHDIDFDDEVEDTKPAIKQEVKIDVKQEQLTSIKAKQEKVV